MSNKGSDRRRFFRVDDQLPLRIEPIDEDAATALVIEIDCAEDSRLSLASSFASISFEMESVLSRIRLQSPDLAVYLKAINQKLDSLATVLMMEEEAEDRLPITAVDLSSAGLAVDWPTPLDPGQAVRVELITRAAAARVLALGRVVSCQPIAPAAEEQEAQQPETASAYRIAVDFQYIRGRDEDFIMQEVMYRQGALLRAQRQNLSAE